MTVAAFLVKTPLFDRILKREFDGDYIMDMLLFLDIYLIHI